MPVNRDNFGGQGDIIEMAFLVECREQRIQQKSDIRAEEEALRRSARNRSLHRGRQQVGNDSSAIDNFEAASNFLKSFHAFASRSLDVIREDNVDESTAFSVTRVSLRTSTTVSSLSTLANQPTFRELQSRHYTHSFMDDINEEWGFDFEDAHLEDQNVPRNFRTTRRGR